MSVTTPPVVITPRNSPSGPRQGAAEKLAKTSIGSTPPGGVNCTRHPPAAAGGAGGGGGGGGAPPPPPPPPPRRPPPPPPPPGLGRRRRGVDPLHEVDDVLRLELGQRLPQWEADERPPADDRQSRL